MCCRRNLSKQHTGQRGVFYADAGGDVLSERTPTVFADPRGTRAFRYAGQGQRLEPTAPFHRLVSGWKKEVKDEVLYWGDNWWLINIEIWNNAIVLSAIKSLRVKDGNLCIWQAGFCCRPENRPCSRAHFHHTHFIIRWHAIISSPSVHHAIIMPSSCNLELTHFIIRWQRYAGRVRGVGGWVGGMITFSTTYIMPLYHHHHIITQSSCHHHAISNVRISSYVDRDTQGGYGGWVGGGGGGDDNIQYDVHHATLSSPSYHHAIIMQSPCNL